MPSSDTPQVRFVEISADNHGQRIDNFLMTQLKGVPKSRIYKILRGGEVRVNKGRIKPGHRLVEGDIVRIPPVRVSSPQEIAISQRLIDLIDSSVLFENDDVIVINKPSGIAVHAGSNINYGVIDILRASRFKDQFIELAHRLDRATSGCLVLAKNRPALTQLNDLLTTHDKVKKQYLALTMGNWPEKDNLVDKPLLKNEKQGGERMVTVARDGKPARSIFCPVEQFSSSSLVSVTLLTGRTHQIRVHASSEQHPLAGDDKYGDRDFNKQMKSFGLKRLFLHAHKLEFTLGEPISVSAPLDNELEQVLENLRKQ